MSPVIPEWNVHTNSVGLSGTTNVAVATSPGSIGPVLRPSPSMAKSWTESSSFVISTVTC